MIRTREENEAKEREKITKIKIRIMYVEWIGMWRTTNMCYFGSLMLKIVSEMRFLKV